MARILGVDLPKSKHIRIAVTYILGIGPTRAVAILEKTKIDGTTRVKDLSEDEIIKIRDCVREYVTEGDLRRKVGQDIKRLQEILTNCRSHQILQLQVQHPDHQAF